MIVFQNDLPMDPITQGSQPQAKTTNEIENQTKSHFSIK
jgi:hypothetical protein